MLDHEPLHSADAQGELGHRSLPTPPPPATSLTVRAPRGGPPPSLVAVLVASVSLLGGVALRVLTHTQPAHTQTGSYPTASAPPKMAAPTPPPAAPPPAAPPPAVRGALRAAPVETATAVDAETAETPSETGRAATPPAEPSGVPAYADAATLKQVLRWALRNAEECHKGGRAAGTAELRITFRPSGRVSDATLIGEPIASAPVGRCALHYARALILPPFDGPPFTVSRTLTIR